MIHILEEFKRVDTDGSGVITKEDFLASGDAFREMLQRSKLKRNHMHTLREAASK